MKNIDDPIFYVLRGEIEYINDISMVIFFITAVTLLPGSELIIKNSFLNEQLTTFINILGRMGADISVEQTGEFNGRGVGKIQIRYAGRLTGIDIEKKGLIDAANAVPFLAVAAACAEGETNFKGIDSLVPSNPDIVKAISINFEKLDFSLSTQNDRFKIKGSGPGRFRIGYDDTERCTEVIIIVNSDFPEESVTLRSFGDHMTTISLYLIPLVCYRNVIIEREEREYMRYAEFHDILNSVLRRRNTNTFFLIGFMGSGKSSTGVLLAEKMGYSFIDLDEMIRKKAGKTIARIFEEEGEEAFRKMESETLFSLRDKDMDNAVIACGGGAPCSEKNLRFMQQSGLLIWFDASAQTLFNRIKNQKGRPLAKEYRHFENLYKDRTLFYKTADIQINTENLPQEEIVEIIQQIF